MDSVPLIADIDRPLADEDFDALEERAPVKAPTLKRLTERHHRLARALAEGLSSGEAALACGYQPSRVSILLDDPSFKELVQFYSKQVHDAFTDLHAKLHGVASTAVDLLQDRLEETPDDFDNAELKELVKMGADRTGHGPSSTTNTNVNVGFAGRLDAARDRIRRHREGDIIDVEPEDDEHE